MAHFSYSLFLSLLHSLWQAPLLLCIYVVFNLSIRKNGPLSKRNILFFLLAAQFFITVSTFLIYYTGTAFYYLEYIDSGLSEVFIHQPFIVNISPWLTSAYFIVLTYKMLMLVFNWHRFKFIGKTSCLKPSIDLKLFTAVKANEFGISRKVSLWYSNTINTPITFGFLRPVILLPVALINNLTVAETETLIIHELTHIKSNDYFLNWLLIICENLFFFNPFITIIAGRIKLEREKNCDTRVLQFKYPALSYAETLLKTARFRSTPAPFILAAAFRNAQLIKRVKYFTEEKNLQTHKKNYTILAMVPLIAFFVLNILVVDLIKNRNIRTTSIAQKTSNINIVLDETIKTHFSTSILPVSKVHYSAIVQPALEPEVNSPIYKETPIKIPEEQNHELTTADIAGPEMIAVPVSLEEQNNTRQVILKEENSATGKSIMKVYQMRFENGEWKATLLWTISETRPASDSLPYLRDTVTRFYDRMQ